jgi:transcriptional regulator with XRE-family HTH domain
MTTDYRDQLEELFQSMRDQHGLTRYRISKQTGISEQRISNLLKKKGNLSAPSLEAMLSKFGYELRFEPTETSGTGDNPFDDRRLIGGR